MEFTKKEYKLISTNFCCSYNHLNKTNYHFLDTDEKNNNNYDFRIIDKDKILKIQCKITIAEEPKDFINLQNMIMGKEHEEKRAYNLIHESDRFKYALENIMFNNKKKYAYSDCILLLIFKHFPFGGGVSEEYYIREMKKTANSFKDYFLEIWIENEPGYSGKYNNCYKIT